MPRIVNPGSLKTGHGKAAPDENINRPSLEGAGLVGSGPNIGAGADLPVTAESAPDHAMQAHIQDPKSAHTAAAIEHDGHPDVLISGNVEGALDELIGTVMEHPPYLGQTARHTTFSGIPDWGFLKLRDQSLEHFNTLTAKPDETDAALIFPYYQTGPGAPQDNEFTFPEFGGTSVEQQGGDPNSDYLWNFGVEFEGAKPPGAGWGRAHNGAFTREGDTGAAPLDVMRTHMLYPRPTGNDAETGRPARVPVTISGTLYPADRGVLALLHIPPSAGGVMSDEFLAQPLISDHTSPLSDQGRVVAALLLGNGLLGDKCYQGECATPHVCDGDVGGIFALGTDPDTGKYNPFTFPGRASGQYDLNEIHSGVNTYSNPLVPPFDDFDGDTVAGAARTPTAEIPAPGQVRLGTDPDAGETPVENGIPVLGARSTMYTVAPVAQNGSLGEPIHGDALVRDSNFFGYRLPVLADYSPDTGLKWTPSGEDVNLTLETFRFFQKSAPVSASYPDSAAVGTSLRSAGFYEGMFDDDYWVWQIARYRQTFLMPSIALDGSREEVGTYWLVHFRTEADFERCVRDGIFPWDVTDGYSVYGSSLASTTHIEDDGNVVNEWPAATVPVSPNGPAPLYGYAADPYHQIRSTIMLDPSGTGMPALKHGNWDWVSLSGAGSTAYTIISGVGYLTPRRTSNGDASFALQGIDINYDAGFWTSYRTDDHDLSTSYPGAAPAILASMNPMFINNAPFAYDTHPTVAGLPSSMDLVTGADVSVAHIPDTFYQRKHRFELPFTFMGSNGSGIFADANGPLDTDEVLYLSAGGGAIQIRGDDANPAFTRDAVLRAYFRRPLDHTSENTAALPYTAANGHGLKLASLTGGTLLFHSTRFDQTNKDGIFGNFVVNAFGGGLPNASYTELFTAEKDTYERFLDETYRLRVGWSSTWAGNYTGTPATLTGYISGPGMNGWAGGPVEVPVRAGLTSGDFRNNSWLLMEDFLTDLSGVDPEGSAGLQVAGLPDRNPPISAGVEVPFPSVGLVMYPQKNYSVGYYPSTGVEIIETQPDYSGATGDRHFIRAFDVAFSHHAGGGSTPPVIMAGQTEVTLRLDGITLADILYAAPGPGGAGFGSDWLAILAKVPGLTTWMDCGRQDGSGPSKQDALLDGAGCLVLDGEKTYTFTDPVTGYKGCYVTIDVGPVASFVANPAVVDGYASGSPLGEVPLLIKVQMNGGAANYNLERQYTGGAFGAVEPGEDPRNVRGLIGIRIMHPDETLIDPD